MVKVKKKQLMTKPNTFNLSNKVLSQLHVKVLCRDFKFKPTPSPNKIEFKNDAQPFAPKLCSLEFFYTKNNSEEDESSDDSIVQPTR